MTTQTFKNGSTSQQKVKLISAAQTGEGTKVHKLNIIYKRTDGKGDDKELSASKFIADITADEKALIKEALANPDKSEVVFTKVFSKKEGADTGYWNLKSITSASDYVEKPKTPYNNNYKKSGGGGSGYDSAGQQTGNVMTNAVTMAIAQHGKDVKPEHVAKIVDQLAHISTELYNRLKAGTATATVISEPQPQAKPRKEATQPEAKAKETVIDDEFDNLDSLDLGF